MFEITDSDGEVWINYKGGGGQWTLAMMQEEEGQLFKALLDRAGGLQNLALDDACEGPDDCDAHHPCQRHAAEANAGRFQQR